jgi:hypothetical protein
LASTLGHVIVFKKGEEIEVPDIIVREAVELGAEFVEDGARDEIFNEPKGEPVTPVNPSERQEAVLAAIAAIEQKNDRDDFTATGNPTLKAIQEQTGFKIDKGELIQAMKTRNEDQ